MKLARSPEGVAGVSTEPFLARGVPHLQLDDRGALSEGADLEVHADGTHQAVLKHRK